MHRLQILNLYLLMLLAVSSAREIRVGTYNLWNVMFAWDVRKHYIARMIREESLDVVAFQEVRFNSKTGENQLSELKDLLPEFPHSGSFPADSVRMIYGSYWTDWDTEGVGILSKYPFTKLVVQKLHHLGGEDTNKRITLHASISVEESDIFFVVVHLSYERKLQCSQMVSILRKIEAFYLYNVIVLGDFNVYTDFEDPIQLFMKKILKKSQCGSLMLSISRQQGFHFKDIGSALTFSNMPTPALVSRPDRILVSPEFRVLSTTVTGNGTKYKALYGSAIFRNRLKRLLSATLLSTGGATGYPCSHTCGPNGVCRCGVCVKKQEDQALVDCNFPHCSECGPTTFLFLVFFLLSGVILVATMGYAVVRILIVSSSFQRHQAVFDILGFSCCLCHPQLLAGPVAPRLYRSRSLLVRFNPLCWLPPYMALLAGFVLLLFLCLLASWLLAASLDTVYNVMEEEFYPSDHRMLIASLESTV